MLINIGYGSVRRWNWFNAIKSLHAPASEPANIAASKVTPHT